MPIKRTIFSLSIVVLVLGLITISVGSVFVRRKVVELLRQRILTSASVVVGKVLSIKRGASLNALHLDNRLKRLGYRKLEDGNQEPSRSGEYVKNSRELILFLREFQLPSGFLQPEQLVRCKLDGEDVVRNIYNEHTGESLEELALEPEVVSFLGTGATRASSPKAFTEFPKQLRDAVVAIEDERFYSHFGIDPIGITRAMFVNIKARRFVQGGSTITQQLAKNLFFSNARKIVRKLAEAVSAVLIETAFSKERILEMYFNEVFLGQEGIVAIHGFGEAAQSFFGKDVRNLDLAECATLAGIIKGPSAYSPRFHPESAMARREVVLRKMLDKELISKSAFYAAMKEEVIVRNALRLTRIAPYFVDYLREELGDQIAEASKDDRSLTIHTTIDPEMQICARDAVASGLRELEKQYPKFRRRRSNSPLQGALVASDPKTGDVVAWVGGRDYGKTQFDRVSNGKRQPGSLFKPFVYLTAFDAGLNQYRVARTTMLLEDEPVTIDIPGSASWEPKNYEGKFKGEVTVREALVHSMNVPTVNLAMKVGIEHVARTAELLGLGEDLPRVPALALGAVEATPLEMLRAYTTIASGGVLLTPRMWDSLTLKGDNTPVMLAPKNEGQQVAAASSVYVLTNVMKDVIEEGTARAVRRLGFLSPAAGKTGTTNDARDAWFAGFTPDLLAIVWTGFDNNDPVGLTGGVAAVPIWTEFMKCAMRGHEPDDFPVPPGVVSRKVDLDSGLLYDPSCSSDRVGEEVFVEGTEPVTSCYRGDIDPAYVPSEDPYTEDEEEMVRGGRPSGRSASRHDDGGGRSREDGRRELEGESRFRQRRLDLPPARSLSRGRREHKKSFWEEMWSW